MVDTDKSSMTNENDDWEIAVDSGEFDKRLEQQEKERIPTVTQECLNDDNKNLIKSNKPIRILKRPTSQTQLPVNNNNSSQTINSSFSNENSSPIIVPIQKNQNKESMNSSQAMKPTIKTYEQREMEYRLARLRIMGEEESSIKDDEDDNSVPVESLSINSDNTSIPVTYPPNVYNSNSNLIHFTPTTNSIEPYSQAQYHPVYSSPYPPMPLLPPSTHYPPTNVYISSPTNPWYNYQQQYTPYDTSQYTHPQ